jgi:hypothetical protein
MKDGLEKELRQNKDKLAIELYDNELAYSKNLISATTFGQRELYIKQNYANEEAKIRKASQDKEIADAKKHNIKKQQVGVGVNLFGGFSAVGPTFTPPVQIEPIVNINLEKAKASIKSQLESLNNAIKNSITNVVATGLSGLGEAIAGALSGDEDPFEAFGVMLIKSLGQMAVQLGTELLAIGTAMLFVPALQASAAGYLLGGAALIVAGSAVSGLAGRKSGGSTQTAAATQTPTSDFNGNGSNYLGGNNSGNIVINGMIKGNDIQLVNGRNDRKFNRSLRFG